MKLKKVIPVPTNYHLYAYLETVKHFKIMKKNRLFDYLARAGCKKCTRIMKLTTFLFFIFVVDAFASYSQDTKISIEVQDGTLSEIFSKIEEQSKYRFFYQNEQIRDSDRKTVHATNENILDIMSELLKETGLSCKLIDRNIIVFPKPESPVNNVAGQPKSISGKVTDSSGQPIPGASVLIKNTTKGTVTDANGTYSLSNVPGNAILQISFIGMESQNITVGLKSVIDIVLETDNKVIKDVVVTALGMKREKKALGFAMQEVKGESLKKPITSIADALQGEVAGAQIFECNRSWWFNPHSSSWSDLIECRVPALGSRWNADQREYYGWCFLEGRF